MRTRKLAPLGALWRGLAAGVAGTAALSASQAIAAKATGGSPPTAAGEVGRRVGEGVLLREVPEKRLPALNQAVHWSYGAAWGGVYGLAQESLRLSARHHGPLFGVLVGTVATVELPALKLMPPPWRVPPQELGLNTLHHLVYGITTALAFERLAR